MKKRQLDTKKSQILIVSLSSILSFSATESAWVLWPISSLSPFKARWNFSLEALDIIIPYPIRSGIILGLSACYPFSLGCIIEPQKTNDWRQPWAQQSADEVVELPCWSSWSSVWMWLTDGWLACQNIWVCHSCVPGVKQWLAKVTWLFPYGLLFLDVSSLS